LESNFLYITASFSISRISLNSRLIVSFAIYWYRPGNHQRYFNVGKFHDKKSSFLGLFVCDEEYYERDADDMPILDTNTEHE
jgi:hypothetical protein